MAVVMNLSDIGGRDTVGVLCNKINCNPTIAYLGDYVIRAYLYIHFRVGKTGFI